MINIKKCSEVSKEIVFKTFKAGFSDYMVKLSIEQEYFFKRFFGAEGNSLELSYIAMDDDKGIGVVLGGIREFDKLKTLRCGTMCIIPEMRGKGIAQELFDLHMETAKKENCKQLFLEVIKGNDRAIKFYEKNGYMKVFDLNYYSTDDFNFLEVISDDSIEVLNFEELKIFRNNFSDVHINWQNETDYMEHTEADYFGIKENGELIAAISSIKGNIMFLGVLEKYRNKNFAKKLIKHSLKENKIINASFSNNASLARFFIKCGFSRKDISQYEMYKYV